MKPNPKPETRNPKEGRSPKAERANRDARGVCTRKAYGLRGLAWLAGAIEFQILFFRTVTQTTRLRDLISDFFGHSASVFP